MNNLPDTIMLFDSEDEINHCWVETAVNEDEARNLVAPFLCDEDGNFPFKPIGSITKQWLCPSSEFYGEQWIPCSPGTNLAREFWSIVVY